MSSKTLIKQGHSVTVITEYYDSLPKTSEINKIKEPIRIKTGKKNKLKFKIWEELNGT